MKNKIGLYILSLWLLFLMIIVLTLKIPICFQDNCHFIGWSELIKRNIVALIAACLLGIGSLSFYFFNRQIKGSTNIPFTITKIESINYEHLTFLATYVIPLICFNFESTRYLIVLGLLLTVMGMIYIKTDLFYANPSLALLKYHIYKVDGNFKGNETRVNIILLTREHLNQGEKVKYIRLDDRIYFAKKIS